MAIRIEPFSSAWVPGIARLNARLDAAGFDPALRLPVDGPNELLAFDEQPCSPLTKRQYLLVDNGEVRGGFMLQEQRCDVAGQAQWVANIQMPLSEGVIDRRFALVALQMLNLILEKKPLLFAVGMGGSLEQPFARLVSTLKWPIALVPFAFYAVHPARFLRQVGVGRSAAMRSARQAAAWSGLGWLGVRALQAAGRLRHRQAGRRPRTVTPERVSAWGGWTDGLWDAYRAECSFAAMRDQQTLPLFHPLSHPRLQVHRFVDEGGQVVGWTALQVTSMVRNRHFGDLRVATVLDAVALPGWQDSVMASVTALGAEAGADVIISNQHHALWRDAQRRVGFLDAPSNYLLALSPRLAAELQPVEGSYTRAHVTRADGDGRVNL
jgi:hypothetical protein